MKKNFVLRQEPFGYTFFNKSRLRHKFIHKDQLDKFLKESGIDLDQVEVLKFKRQDYRNDILYSPIRIYYEVTLSCNLRCRYCFNTSGKPSSNELETSEVLKSLDDFRKCNVLDIRFTGGELTCRKDWFEILKHAKALGFGVSCNTNGVFSNPEVCEQFAELNLEQVAVSIDGNKRSHEMNRGVGTLNRTVENIRRMHSLGVRLRINTLVNKYSINDVEYILDLASKYTDEINFFTIVFIGRGSHLESSDGVTVKDHYGMSRRINKLKSKYPNLNILHFAEVSRKSSVNKELGEEFGLKIGPPSGSTTFSVTSNGLYSCSGYMPYIDSSFVMGDIRKDSLFDVWQKNSLLEKVRNDCKKLILFCRKCPKSKASKCQGFKYETELHRLLNPGVKNLTCIYGEGPSLLTLC